MYGMLNVNKYHPSLPAASHIILQMGKKVHPVENKKKLWGYIYCSLVVQWLESLTINHEVSGSIPGSNVVIFFQKGMIPAVTMAWVGWQNLGLRALLALHPPLSSLTSSGQRNCTSWASQPQKSVTLLPYAGGRTTKYARTCGENVGKNITFPIVVNR